jgi:hypothetical protein
MSKGRQDPSQSRAINAAPYHRREESKKKDKTKEEKTKRNSVDRVS